METLRKVILGLVILGVVTGVALAGIFGPTMLRELRKAAAMPPFDPWSRVSGDWVRLEDGRILIVGAQPRGNRSAEYCDPATGLFSDAPGLRRPRRFDVHAAVLPGGSVLVAGGSDGSLGDVQEIECLDPERKAWKIVGRIPRETRVSDLVALDDGSALLVTEEGGADGLLRFQPANGELEPVGHPSMVVNGTPLGTRLKDGRVLITHLDYGLELPGSTNAFLYDPKLRRTAALPPLAHGRSQHQATLMPDGRVLITGGTHGDPPAAEIFDPRTDTFSAAGSMVANRSLHVAAALPDGRVLVIGGVSPVRTGSGPAPEQLLAMKPEELRKILPTSAPLASEVEIYDPGSNAFAPVGEPPSRIGSGFGSSRGRGFMTPVGVLFLTMHGLVAFDASKGTWTFPAMGSPKRT